MSIILLMDVDRVILAIADWIPLLVTMEDNPLLVTMEDNPLTFDILEISMIYPTIRIFSQGR